MDGGSTSPLVLVVGSDDRYAMPLAVTLHSALTRLTGEIPVRVHVFDGGISEGNRRRVERVVRGAQVTAELEWHVPNRSQLEGLREVQWMTTATYLRLLVPEILAEEDIVVFLDSDLLVRNDLSLLLRHAGRSSGSAVSAVEDFRHPDLGDVLGDQQCVELGVDPRAGYFNAGVLVIDVKKWQNLQVAERALALVRENASIMLYPDQDALNVVLSGHWHRLDPRWNVMLLKVENYIARRHNGRDDRERIKRDMVTGASVFHFIGPHKPWAASYQGLARAEYLQAVRNSGWFQRKRELMIWRARLAIPRALWRFYRLLPERIRATVRTVSKQRP